MDNNNPNPNPSPMPSGSSHGTYLTINAFLGKTDVALTNAGSAIIAPLLKARGYDPSVIEEKKVAASALRTLNEAQQKEYGEQYEATSAYGKAYTMVHEAYMDHLKLARIAFKNDPGAKTALGLRGDRPRSQSGYVGQGLLFYNNALGKQAFLDGLATKGITRTELEDGRVAFENLQSLTAAQQKETGEAQASTKKRDAAYDELSDWMSDFYGTAKVALRKHPQLMEQLGIVEE